MAVVRMGKKRRLLLFLIFSLPSILLTEETPSLEPMPIPLPPLPECREIEFPYDTPNREALAIKAAYKELQKAPLRDLKEKSKRYLEVFPDNPQTFLEIFDVKEYGKDRDDVKKFGSLYDNCADYVLMLNVSFRFFPEETMAKCVKIASEMTRADYGFYMSDAPAVLQDLLTRIATQRPDLFAREVKKLPFKKQRRVAKFLSNFEFPLYLPLEENTTDYGKFLRALKRIGEMRLYDLFLKAKEERDRETETS